jgi:hypothetical protein
MVVDSAAAPQGGHRPEALGAGGVRAADIADAANPGTANPGTANPGTAGGAINAPLECAARAVSYAARDGARRTRTAFPARP